MILLKYNTATTIDGIPLITRGAVDYKVNPTLSAGDVQISLDSSSFTNITTTPTVTPLSGTSVKLTLSAAEMLAKHIVIRFIDQTNPKEWEDNSIIIHTYGHADAQYKFDFDSIYLDTSITSRASQTSVNNIPTTPLLSGDSRLNYLDAAITSRSSLSISDIYNHVMEGSLTFEQFQRIIFAALAGKSTGGGSNSVTFKDFAGTGDRISATVDANGNRTAITVSGS